MLDLGVDFSPVDQVLQMGSPKGIARPMQRAGRSAHRPGETARVYGVPTHALEFMEFAAARAALGAGQIEERLRLEEPLDVLVQHLVTCALGGGFRPEALLAEVRGTWAYRALAQATFDWALAMVEHGGATLSAYDQHHRIAAEDEVYRVTTPRVACCHRLGIGTITADATMDIRFLRGARIGTIVDDFIARLRPGDRFNFAGRSLEFVMVRDLVAYVRPSKVVPSLTPTWSGSRFRMSTSLGAGVRLELERAACGEWAGASMELVAARPVLEEQARLSRLPRGDELLVERWRARGEHHLFLQPFEGRRAHQALAALLALRLGRRGPAPFSLTVNDHGIELVGDTAITAEELSHPWVLSPEHVVDDLTESVNLGELAKRQFRDIARVARLVFHGYPGAGKGARQVPVSSSLVYDVFARHDPDNLLLHQARREVFEQQFELARLERALERLGQSRVTIVDIPHPMPLALPLVIDRLGSRLSTEQLVTRVKKMIASWQD
jgi:ATP-dependent Lhr-like helicase